MIRDRGEDSPFYINANNQNLQVIGYAEFMRRMMKEAPDGTDPGAYRVLLLPRALRACCMVLLVRFSAPAAALLAAPFTPPCTALLTMRARTHRSPHHVRSTGTGALNVHTH